MVPASADEPPPPRGAKFAGTVNRPASTTCAEVICALRSGSAASFSHSAGVRAGFCAATAAGTSMTERTRTERMGADAYACRVLRSVAMRDSSAFSSVEMLPIRSPNMPPEAAAISSQ